jgi:hypothetical protein
MGIVVALDVHRTQITYKALDRETGELSRGRIAPAARAEVRAWLGRFVGSEAEFALEGPFAAGTRGTTKMPGQLTNSWIIRDVDPGRAYTIEGSSFLENALLLVHWQFDSLLEDRTRLTQRLELSGENAARYADKIRSAFEPNLEPGMQRIARMMVERAGC